MDNQADFWEVEMISVQDLKMESGWDTYTLSFGPSE